MSAVQKLVILTFSSGVHVWGTGPALARVWDLETSICGLTSHIRLCHLVPSIHGLGFSFGTITQLGSRDCSRAQALGSVVWLWVQGKNCSPSSRISVWGPDCGSDICCLSTDGHCLQFDSNGNPILGCIDNGNFPCKQVSCDTESSTLSLICVFLREFSWGSRPIRASFSLKCSLHEKTVCKWLLGSLF